jgi:mono/diheme cytochrome c family protein
MNKFFKNSTVIISSLIFMSFMLFAFTPGDQKPWNVPAKYKSMKNSVKSDPTSINAGKAIYAKHCKSCHGGKGLGDGPKAASLKSKIRSFASKEYKSQTPGEKYYESFVGRDEMPNFEKKVLDESDRWSLINYIDTF